MDEFFNEYTTSCSRCQQLLLIKFQQPYSLNKFMDSKDELICKSCYCKYECSFYQECNVNNKGRMEFILGCFESELIDAGFGFEGNRFIDVRKDKDCYALFYIIDGTDRYKCEISVMFFEK